MAMVAGSANIGQVSATDFISTQSFGLGGRKEDQDDRINKLISAMVEQKRTYWSTTQVPAENWPGPTLILATPGTWGEDNARIWRVELEGEGSKVSEILAEPGIKLEGAYDEVFCLLYGIHFDVLNGLCLELGIAKEDMWKAMRSLKVLRPYDKLNLWAMPVQDAIDMAVFLAMVQVEMDRFLPGTPACGGPIDVMVLQMAPQPGIVSYPGKTVHHPRAGG